MKRSAKHSSSAVLIQHLSTDKIEERFCLSADAFSRTALAVVAMGILFLAPNPAFAQHGGGSSSGGGGGHSSGGGGSSSGGGGGSHSSGGSSGGGHSSSGGGGSSHSSGGGGGTHSSGGGGRSSGSNSGGSGSGSHGSGGGNHFSGSGGSNSGSSGGGSHASGGNSSTGGATGSSHQSIWSRIFHGGSSSTSTSKSVPPAGTSSATAFRSTPGAAPMNTLEPVRVEPPHVTIGFPPSDTVKPIASGDGAALRTGTLNFSGQGNEIWQEPSKGGNPVSTIARAAGPPQQSGGATKPASPEPRTQTPRAPFNGVRLIPPVSAMPPNTTTTPRVPRIGGGARQPYPYTPTPPRVRAPHPRRPIYPIYPIYPGYPGGGYGYFPFLGFGTYWITGCNPWWMWTWDCSDNSYYSPPSSSGSYNVYAPAANPTDTLLYLKDGTVYDVTDYWLADGQVRYKTVDGVEGSFGVDQLDLQQTVNSNADRGVTFILRPAPTDANAAAPSETMLYLKDGTVYDVTDYWLASGQVHYKTANGEESSFDLEQLDLERSVNVNADRGVTFVLQPAPPAAPDAAPDAAPMSPDATPNASPDNASPPDSTQPPPTDQ